MSWRIWKRKHAKLSSQKIGDDGVFDFSGVDPFDVARSIVGASVIVRKTEQSINWNSMLLALIFLVGLPAWWLNALGNKVERQTARANERATRMADIRNGDTVGAYAGLSTPITEKDIWKTPGAVETLAAGVFFSTVEAGYTPTSTQAPTFTASPVVTATALYSVNVVFRYSYYNPKLGGVNCFEWDYATADCRSMMADGSDWRDQYGKAVACPPDIALGTVVEVTYPDALKGIWICKDRGGAIVGDLIDFLDIRQRAEWLSSVSATLYPPSTPVEQITKGTH